MYDAFTSRTIPGKHFHAFADGNTITVDISSIGIGMYYTFEVALRTLYAEPGAITSLKWVFNSVNFSNVNKSHEIYNTTGVEPVFSFTHNENQLLTMTITMPARVNTYDLIVSL